MSSRSLAWTSIVLGALAVLSIPAGTLIPGRALSVDLVPATTAGVVAAFVFGLAGVSAARRARLKIEFSLQRTGDRQARYGRTLVLVGLYLGTIGAIALVFYGLVASIS